MDALPSQCDSPATHVAKSHPQGAASSSEEIESEMGWSVRSSTTGGGAATVLHPANLMDRRQLGWTSGPRQRVLRFRSHAIA